MTVSPEDIAWAKQALSEGRSMSFIASVLETSERKARNAIFGINSEARRVFREQVQEFDDVEVEEDRGKKKREQKIKSDYDAVPRDRRKCLLRRRFAKHWDMIWFLRGCGMAGRTLRRIYGAECLIWSVGGGIDIGIDT